MLNADENIELGVDVKAQNTVSVGKVEETCTSGIQRFTNGTDNTWQTFKDANAAGASLFEDKGFSAERSSLYWIGKGMPNNVQNMKDTIKGWKRPSEMPYNVKSPSFWGSYGKPVPEGVV